MKLNYQHIQTSALRILRALLSSTGMLTILFVSLAVLIFCVIHRIKTFNNEGVERTRKIYELNSLVDSRDKWEQRSIWVSQEVPRFGDRKEAADHLIKLVNKAIEKEELEIQINEVRHQSAAEMTAGESPGHFEKTSVEVTFMGTEQEIIAFVHRLQMPENFAGVDHIAIEMTDLGLLLCEVKVTQWFIPPWRQVENITVSLTAE